MEVKTIASTVEVVTHRPMIFAASGQSWTRMRSRVGVILFRASAGRPHVLVLSRECDPHQGARNAAGRAWRWRHADRPTRDTRVSCADRSAGGGRDHRLRLHDPGAGRGG